MQKYFEGWLVLLACSRFGGFNVRAGNFFSYFEGYVLRSLVFCTRNLTCADGSFTCVNTLLLDVKN